MPTVDDLDRWQFDQEIGGPSISMRRAVLRVGRRLYWVGILLAIAVGLWYHDVPLAGLMLILTQLSRWYCDKLEAAIKLEAAMMGQRTDAEVPRDRPDRDRDFFDSLPDRSGDSPDSPPDD
jgi:hypothetical protein